MKVSEFPTLLGQTLKGCVKMAVQSRRPSLRSVDDPRPLVIMGNGPSLRNVLDTRPAILSQAALMSVNFAALAPEFFELKPQYYVMADGVFFSNDPNNANLVKLHTALASVDWPMTIIVPRNFRKSLPKSITANANLTVRTINAVGVEGFGWFERSFYSSRLAMPRPRNVLIVSLMAGIWLGYKKIYITGADHSWMQTIAVDEQNRVISVQPHFYKDSASEQRRVNSVYEGYHLHDIIMSFYVAFRSYHRIQTWASRRGVTILNATPDSFIDAFPRQPLP